MSEINSKNSRILFSKKIKCVHCGSNFKSKKERGKRVYLCSRYENYGKSYCRRSVIHEDMIIDLLNRRFGEEVSLEDKADKVEGMSVVNKTKFKIYLTEGEPIEFGDNFIQY